MLNRLEAELGERGAVHVGELDLQQDLPRFGRRGRL